MGATALILCAHGCLTFFQNSSDKGNRNWCECARALIDAGADTGLRTIKGNSAYDCINKQEAIGNAEDTMRLRDLLNAALSGNIVKQDYEIEKKVSEKYASSQDTTKVNYTNKNVLKPNVSIDVVVVSVLFLFTIAILFDYAVSKLFH
jgi:hypothetical protein